MTPHEKAVEAINKRLERLQANLREEKGEGGQRFLLQSIIALIALSEGLNDYLATVEAQARRRHAELKRASEDSGARHAELLKSGQELLEKLKANPGDRAIRKEIERLQKAMADVPKDLRREANELQRELSRALGAIDEMAVSVRRFAEAQQVDVLKALLKEVAGLLPDGTAQPAFARPTAGGAAALREVIGAAELENDPGFHDSFARIGQHIALAIELLAMAASENPPQSAADAIQRATEAVALRVKAITGRLSVS